MKPYSGVFNKRTIERVFNYRLSRARRIVENVFGISVFRVLRTPMFLKPEIAQVVVVAFDHLHKFLKSKISKNKYTSFGSMGREEDGIIIKGTWREVGVSTTN